MSFTRVILPILALGLGVGSSVYLSAWWWAHRRTKHAQAVLLWAIALFLMFWYQAPAILVGLGKLVTLTDFNLFFSLTFPITFLAFILIFLGILRIAGVDLDRRRRRAIYVWFAASIVFFGWSFILNKGIIHTYFVPVAGNLAFYVIIRAIIIITLVRMMRMPELRTRIGRIGAWLVIAENVLGLGRNFFILDRVFSFPPQFWYIHIAQSEFFFVAQTVSVILLAWGFFFLHRAFSKTRALRS